jgi:diacylglycerol kinase (ATP)
MPEPRSATTGFGAANLNSMISNTCQRNEANVGRQSALNALVIGAGARALAKGPTSRGCVDAEGGDRELPVVQQAPLMLHRGTPGEKCSYRLMRALLVHNPTAGTKNHDRGSIVDALQLGDIKVDYVSTKDDGVTRALRRACDVVIAAGGDGTIGYVFTHLADRSIPIGILPLGSANNIARSLGIAGTPAELAERWRGGQVHSFHLVEVNYSPDRRELCAEGFGVGLIAALIKRLAKGRKTDGAGDIRRGRRALTALVSDAELLDLEVNIDGKPWKSDLISVDVLNIPFSGPALPLAHNADPADTLLDAIGFESGKRDELIEWINSPREDAPPVSTRRGKQIEIRWRDADSRLDDKVAKENSDWQQVLIRCDPEPLHILVPAKHPAIKNSAKIL